MATSVKDRINAIDIIQTYSGNNPYILMLKKDVLKQDVSVLNDFAIEYVNKNHDFQPKKINKTIKIADWYAEKKKNDWGLDFLPEKLAVKVLLGETDTTYHCYVKFRQNMEPKQCFLPKKGILTNFLVNDYNDIQVDFDRYDRLSMSKDINRRMKNHQKTAVKFLLSRKKCILADDMGLGKMEPVSSLIPTPNGFKRMGDIVEGDKVFDMHGHAVEVLKTFPHKNKDIYEVTISDGTKVKCGLEHLWYVRNTNWKDKRWETLSLEQIIESGISKKISESQAKQGTKIRNKWMIPTVKPIEYEEKSFFIHPYVLGLCIGDGNMCNGRVSISIPENETESADRVRMLLNEGYTLHKDISSNCPRYNIVKNANNTSYKNLYIAEFKKLNLDVHGNEKFIPKMYKLGSIEQRKELLKGLMDSDGSITKKGNKICYSTNSEQLANDVSELVFSLGGVAKIRSYERDKFNKKTIEYSVVIQIDFCPFRLQRKVERYHPTFKKYLTRYIQSVELIGKEDAQCIYVDSPEHTYVTGKHYVVTHNTLELSVAAIEGNFDSVLIICPASIKTNWKKELSWYVPEKDITIIEGIQGKNKSELELMLGYGVGKSGKKVSELQEEAKERGKWQDNRFVIVNFDILDEFYQIPATRSKENIQKAYENSPMLQYIKDKKSLIIIDEAHRLSNSTSIRYKVIRDLIKRGEPHSIYAATGTPITNNPRNLYCVLQFLNDPITDDYNYYMERYCGAFKVPAKGEKEKWTNIWHQRGCDGDLKQFIRDNAKMIQVATDGTNLDELKERISHMYLRRTKEDFNDIVEKTIHEVFYDLSYTQQCEYDKLWEEYEEAKLNEDPEKELNKELLEGGLYRKYLSNQMVPNTISMTDDFIENNEKVVIACCYDEELYTLREYFGEKCVIYNGKMSLKEKDEAVRKFMNDNDTKIFIGNINAAGVGITLTSATKLIFNNISFVPGDNQQMCDRIHRLNQTKPVDIYYQLFRGTQYEKMWNIVLKKELIINQVIKKENEK